VKSTISRSPFPLNVNIINITELHQVISRHVDFLQTEIKKAENAKVKILSLYKAEQTLVDNLKKVELLEKFYEKFWEEKTPKLLSEKREEIIQKYEEIWAVLQEEIDNFRDFDMVAEKSRTTQSVVEELDRKTQKLFSQYEELFDSIKKYLKAGSAFVERFKDNIISKLEKSDKRQIEAILNSLASLYDGTLIWLEEILNNISEKIISISDLPKTRKTILEEEFKLRKTLIKEIKDLSEIETSVLLKIVEASASRKTRWLPLIEACEIIAQQMDIPFNEAKKIMLNISEKGFLSLAIGF